MNANHPIHGKALGAGGAHVIFFQNLEHGRARHARDDGQRHGAEHDGGEDEMTDRVPEGALLARQQTVDQHEVGDCRIVIFDEIDAARDGRQMQGV